MFNFVDGSMSQTPRTHPDRILSSCPNPWRLYQLEGHVVRRVLRVQLSHGAVSMMRRMGVFADSLA